MRGGTTYFVNVGTSTVQLCGASYARRRLRLFGTSNNRVTIGNTPTLTIDQGPTIQQGTPPLTFDEHGDGLTVARAWYAIAAAAGAVVGVEEVIDVA